MGAEHAVVARRTVLAGTAAVAGAAALGVGAAAPAEAATTAVLKKVVLYQVVKYRYNATTRVTTVLSYKKIAVVARFVGSKVYLKNSKGVWIQVPYVWSKAKAGLWFSRYLQIQIAAAAASGGAEREILERLFDDAGDVRVVLDDHDHFSGFAVFHGFSLCWWRSWRAGRAPAPGG